MEKDKKKSKNEWPEFKENYYNSRGANYDTNMEQIEKEKADNFINYLR